jgi:uncharacterized membrane protein (UPF0136 family)
MAASLPWEPPTRFETSHLPGGTLWVVKSVNGVLLINGLLILYALMNEILGIYAYAVKQSIPSIIGGTALCLLTFGSLALYSKNPRAGRMTAAAVTLLGVGSLAKDAMQGKWQGQVEVGASIAMFAILLGAHFLTTSRKRASG